MAEWFFYQQKREGTKATSPGRVSYSPHLSQHAVKCRHAFHAAILHDVGVNHSRGYLRMSEQF